MNEKVSMTSLTSLYPERCPEMLLNTSSKDGVVEVSGLTFKLDKDFEGGTYHIVCSDVTKGLPPRMRMKPTRILFKIADLDEKPVDDKPDPKAAKGKKK